MRTTIIILVSIFIVFGCKTTQTNLSNTQKEVNYIPYYLKVYEADSLYIIGDYQSSYHILDSLFRVYEPVNMDFYREYETYVALTYLNNEKNLRRRFSNSFELYGSNMYYISNDSILNLALNKSKLKNKQISKLISNYNKSLNKTLRDTIRYIVQLDQEVRKGENIDFDVLNKVNESNITTLKFIFEKYGYPSRNKIGYSIPDNNVFVELDAIYKHIGIEFMQDYLIALLEKSLKNGECNPYTYASVVDRYNITTNDAQLYGSYLNDKRELIKLMYPNKLDSIRKSIGLPNINYQQWRLKKKYKIEY